MSVSKWLYTEECDGEPCVGDCEFCGILGDEDYEYYLQKNEEEEP